MRFQCSSADLQFSFPKKLVMHSSVKAAETNMSWAFFAKSSCFLCVDMMDCALFLGYTYKPTSHHLWLSSDNSGCLSGLSSRYRSMLTWFFNISSGGRAFFFFWVTLQCRFRYISDCSQLAQIDSQLVSNIVDSDCSFFEETFWVSVYTFVCFARRWSLPAFRICSSGHTILEH